MTANISTNPNILNTKISNNIHNNNNNNSNTQTQDMSNSQNTFTNTNSSASMSSNSDINTSNSPSNTNANNNNNKKKIKGRIFQCTGYPNCSMNFTRSEHLARHIRKHTGERPFKCPHCSRNFSRLDNLRQHKQTVHAYENFVITYPGDKYSIRLKNDDVDSDERLQHKSSSNSLNGINSQIHQIKIENQMNPINQLNQQSQISQQTLVIPQKNTQDPETPTTQLFISPPNSSSPIISVSSSQQNLPPAPPQNSLLRPLQFRPKRRPRPIALPQNSTFISNSNPNTPLSLISPLSPLYNQSSITPTSSNFLGRTCQTSPLVNSFPPITENSPPPSFYHNVNGVGAINQNSITLPPLPIKFAPSDFKDHNFVNMGANNSNIPNLKATSQQSFTSFSATNTNSHGHSLSHSSNNSDTKSWLNSVLNEQQQIQNQSCAPALTSQASNQIPLQNLQIHNQTNTQPLQHHQQHADDFKNRDNIELTHKTSINNLLNVGDYDDAEEREKFKLPSVNTLGL